MTKKEDKIKIGQKYEVISKTSSHSVPIGSKVTISHQSGVATLHGGNWFCTEFPNNGYLFGKDLKKLSSTKEEIQEEIQEKQKELDTLKLKLKFIKENKLDEYDENVFKSYSILQLLNTSKSDIDKAKIIAELIGN